MILARSEQPSLEPGFADCNLGVRVLDKDQVNVKG